MTPIPAMALALVLLNIPLAAFGHDAPYDSDRFEFAVVDLRAHTYCRETYPDHGITILLNRSDRCRDLRTSSTPLRLVRAEGSYNLAEVSGIGRPFTTVWQLADDECRQRSSDFGGLWQPWFGRRTINGRPTAGCRIDYPDGQIEFLLSVLHRNDPTNPADWSKITYRLHTDTEHLVTDLAAYDALAGHIRIKPEVGSLTGGASPSAPASGDRPTSHVIKQFNFAVVGLDRMPTCFSVYPDYGIDILLDRTAPCTDLIAAESSTRQIGIFGLADVYAPPVTGRVATVVAQLALHQCTLDSLTRGGRWQPWPDRAALGGKPATGCRIDLPDGRIWIRLFVLYGVGCGASPCWWGIAYELTTDQDHLAVDLAVYQALAEQIIIGAGDGPTQARPGLGTASPAPRH